MKTILACVSVVALALFVAPGLAAADPIVEFTGGTTTLGGGDFTVGYTFSITNPILVDALSWWDEGGDGLASAHDVGLWTSGGVLLASVTVSNSSAVEVSSSGFGNWMVESISPLVLGIGDYVVGGVQTNSTGGDLLRLEATAWPVAGVVYGDTVQNVGNGLVLTMPDDLVGFRNDGAWGPNVHFDTAAVPEPGSLALLGLGLMGLVAARRRRTRA